MKIAVFCVGNKLMLDDGIGPAVYDELASYEFSDDVDVLDVGCMSMDCLFAVNYYDLLITVDAINGTGADPGTIFRFLPDDMASRPFGAQSLHDLRLSDLFEAASLLGFEAQGVCLGMQVDNAEPADLTVGLTPCVAAKLNDLVDCVLAELVAVGQTVRHIPTGKLVEPGWHHSAAE